VFFVSYQNQESKLYVYSLTNGVETIISDGYTTQIEMLVNDFDENSLKIPEFTNVESLLNMYHQEYGGDFIIIKNEEGKELYKKKFKRR